MTAVRIITLPYDAQAPWAASGPHGAGVVTATVRPGRSGPNAVTVLADDLLTELGHPGVRATEDLVGMAAPYLSSYLAAHHIDDVVLTAAERLHPAAVAPLRALLGPARLWLAGEAPFDPRPRLSQADSVLLTAAQLATTWQERRAPKPCAAAPCRPPLALAVSEPFPPVPADEALTFLASTTELLDTDDAQQVRTVTLEAAGRTVRACAPLLPGAPGHDRLRGPSAIEVAAHHVRLEAEHAHDVNEAVARLRGVQLGLLRAGWWLDVNIDPFVETYLTTPDLVHGDPARWTQLGAFRQPHIGATAALAAAGVGRAALETLPASAVALTGASIRERWRSHPVPLPARFFLRAQHAYLRVHGADAGTRFLSALDETGQLAPLHTGQVRTAIAAPAKHLSLLFHDRPRAWTHTDERAWARRWALGIHPISSHTRAVSR